MVWLHPEHAARCDDAGGPDDGLRAGLRQTMERLATQGAGSSQRVERLLVLREPPALDAGEITDKGYVNQRAVRERRADRVAMLSTDPPPPQVVVRQDRSHA
jgi:feruloyl-CoA synthase